MGDMGDGEAGRAAGSAEPGAESFTCDFCGQAVAHVRRIALDGDYDRLQTPHRVQYACDACSAAKERERLARRPG